MKTLKGFLKGYEVRELLEFSEHFLLKYNVDLEVSTLLVAVIRSENFLSIDFSMNSDTWVSKSIRLDMSLGDKAVEYGYNELLKECKNEFVQMLIQSRNKTECMISVINNMQRKEIFGDIQ